MNIAEASTALKQSSVQTEAAFRVQRMAMDQVENQSDGLQKMLQGAALQPGDAAHMGNLVDVQA